MTPAVPSPLARSRAAWGLAPLVHHVADDTEHEAIAADALRRAATAAFAQELGALHDDLARGTFLRAEALRQWHAFVGADEITRLFSSGIGRVRGTLVALVRGAPRAPVAEVREEALADIGILARSHVAEACRRTASSWAADLAVAPAIDGTPELWGPSPGFDGRLARRLEAWVGGIADDVGRSGGPRRRLARGASIGVNAAGVGVMLATFAHTGGLTGTEVGVAAATAFLNQRLLEALFGEAAMHELIGRARRGLDDALGAALGEELGRFEALVPDGGALRDLAARLRSAADDLAAFVPVVPLDARGVMDAPGAGDRQAREPVDAVRQGAQAKGRATP